jgi:hypothetical protein
MFRHIMGRAKAVIPPPALSLDFFWNGPSPLNVTGASGSTTGSNYFFHATTGATSENWTIVSVSSTSGSSTASLTTLGTQLGVAWGAMNVGDLLAIEVKYTASDGTNTIVRTDTATLKRVA